MQPDRVNGQKRELGPDDALSSLERIAKIRKSAGQIQRTAVSIDTEAESLESTLTRLLTQVRTALESVLRESRDDVA